MTSQGLQVMEKFCEIRVRNPRAGFADVARVLGIHRSIVTRHMKRAEAIGLIVRVGRTVYLCVKSILKLSEEGRLARRARLKKREYKRKLWKLLGKSESVDTLSTHRRTEVSKEEIEAYRAANDTWAENARAASDIWHRVQAEKAARAAAENKTESENGINDGRRRET